MIPNQDEDYDFIEFMETYIIEPSLDDTLENVRDAIILVGEELLILIAVWCRDAIILVGEKLLRLIAVRCRAMMFHPYFDVVCKAVLTILILAAMVIIALMLVLE